MTWKRQAACLGQDTNTFYEPHTGTRLARARTVCAGCPVRLTCLAEALRLRDFHGIHGGTTGAERRALLRPRHRSHTRSRRRDQPLCLHRSLHADAFVLLITQGGVLTLHVASSEGAWSRSEHGPGRYLRLATALAQARRATTARRRDSATGVRHTEIDPITGEDMPRPDSALTSPQEVTE